ncbi:MAG: thiamine-phosphate kinase [Pseudomonadota bacterium]|nr:thiamine-phosphate kinase [Pseudomonadota bacterium]
MNEFELIRRYFTPLYAQRAEDGVTLGIGDDAALLAPRADHELAVTTDTLIAGRHFPVVTSAYDIGWKALAVNLSDLAAMAAEPRWFTLALSLPDANETWLQDFARGLQALAQQHHIVLVGGDTTRGPLSITITAIGEVPRGKALRRDGARPGDLICVTGTLGDAAAGLREVLAGQPSTEYLLHRLNRPLPRVTSGRAMRGLATAMIDLSDGLAGDLQHILDASGVGAVVDAAALPSSAVLMAYASDAAVRRSLQLSGGDDYELCLCIPAERLVDACRVVETPLSVIGRITAEPGFRLGAVDGATIELKPAGYQHF